MSKFVEFDRVILSCLFIDGNMLPQGLQTAKNCPQSLAVLELKMNRIAIKHDPRAKKRSPEREAIIAQYAIDAANEQPITYNVNESRLNNNELLFAKLLIESGVIDADDLV